MSAYVAGDVGAFDELFRRYSALLVRALVRRSATLEEARDQVQETFLQLHRARFDFHDGSRFRPWVFTIALNVQRQAARSRARRPEVSLELEALQLADAATTSDRTAEAELIRAAPASPLITARRSRFVGSTGFPTRRQPVSSV